MNLIQRTVVAINEVLNYCPQCGSRTINELDSSASHIKLECQDCFHTWTDLELAYNRETIITALLVNGLYDEAQLIKDMTQSTYKDFLEKNLELYPIH